MPWYVAHMLRRSVGLALVLLGCGSKAPAVEADQATSGPVAGPVREAPSPAAAPTLAGRYPSVGHYPDPHSSLPPRAAKLPGSVRRVHARTLRIVSFGGLVPTSAASVAKREAATLASVARSPSG